MIKGSTSRTHLSRSIMTAIALGISAAMATATTAQPQTPQVRNVTLSSDFQTKLEKELGVREAELLKKDLKRMVEAALQKAPGSTVSYVDLVIEDAAPTRPTFQQLTKTLPCHLPIA